MKHNRNMIVNEEPRYKISLKKGYRILYIVMSIFFLIGTLYFGIISFSSVTDTMLFGIGFTGIFLIFLFYSLYGLTKKCEKYKGKVVYSVFLKTREYNLSDITFLMKKLKNVIRIMAMAM